MVRNGALVTCCHFAAWSATSAGNSSVSITSRTLPNGPSDEIVVYELLPLATGRSHLVALRLAGVEDLAGQLDERIHP